MSITIELDEATRRHVRDRAEREGKDEADVVLEIVRRDAPEPTERDIAAPVERDTAGELLRPAGEATDERPSIEEIDAMLERATGAVPNAMSVEELYRITRDRESL